MFTPTENFTHDPSGRECALAGRGDPAGCPACLAEIAYYEAEGEKDAPSAEERAAHRDDGSCHDECWDRAVLEYEHGQGEHSDVMAVECPSCIQEMRGAVS